MNELLDSGQPSLYEVITAGSGPQGKLPLTDDLLRNQPSGHAFGMSQDVGHGLDRLGRGRPAVRPVEHLGRRSRRRRHAIALGYHTGHWEVVLAVKAAAEEIEPLAAACPTPAIAPIPATAARRARTGMFDSLAYRNDAAIVLRRLARSHPQGPRRAGRGHLRQGAAGDDDGPGRPATTCPPCWFPAA